MAATHAPSIHPPPAAPPGELCVHDHLCLIYESPEEQLEGILPFVRTGLAQGDRLLYVADAATVDGIGAALSRGGVDVDASTRAGRLAMATGRQAYLATGRFDPDVMLDYAAGVAHQSVGQGYRALRIAGEMSWALGGDPGSERLIEYEVKVNERLARTPAMAICQYDRRRFSPELIRDVIRTHPLVWINGRVCRNFYYVPPGELVGADRLHHEVDRLLQNIEERERAEDALRESERRLHLATRLASVGTLAAGVAHEINNPLAFVAGNLAFLAERLEAGGADPELRRAVAEALDGASRIRATVQGLRRLSRPADGTPRAPVDVAAELSAGVAIARAQVASRARLSVDLAPGLPAVEAGPNELAQVAVNLLVNAAQATPEGRAGEHEVRLAARAERGGVVVVVSDTGAGMTPEVQARIFDPFFTTKDAGAGTGLGLAICHGIVAGLGGAIDVESAPGRGTTFRVRLPAAGHEAVPAAPAPAEDGSRRRVLVVDDEPLVGRVIARLLAGHEVEVLASAEEAARRLEAGERWDLVLCDLIMPALTGMELAARLERTAPDALASLVFMTGGAYTEGARAFEERSGRRFVEKPIEPEALRALVRAAPKRS
ncbi:MAG TPA: MEDS domain-containing protein [Anaeromyxobacteraceae bacterium]|nr:MEDS domain-containing protein [Anaeromyxobacteraceae bacterium]